MNRIKNLPLSIPKDIINVKGALEQKQFVERAQQKLRDPGRRTTEPVPELVTPQYKKPVEPITVKPITTPAPSLDDFIQEAQKLGEQRTQAQVDIAARNIPELAEQLSRRLISQNVGAASGAGQQLQERAIGQFQERLEPIVREAGIETAVKQLELQRQERAEGRAEAREVRTLERQDREAQLDRIMSGQVDPNQMSAEDWQALGVTDPNAVRTLAQVDIRNAMIADGLDPNNPVDQRQYRQGLRDAKQTQIREQIVANFAAVNDGQLPTNDEIEMMMYIYSGETGLLTPEEENAMINKYNQEQWQRTVKKARAMNPPQGKVLCTELFRQKKISREVFKSDILVGKYYSRFFPDVVIGYHLWAKPLTRAMRKSKLITFLVKPFVLAWALQMHAKLTHSKQNILGLVIVKIGIPLCSIIGKIKNARDTKKIVNNIKRKGEITCQV